MCQKCAILECLDWIFVFLSYQALFMLFKNIYQIVHLKYVQFVIHQWYLNKTVKKIKLNLVVK